MQSIKKVCNGININSRQSLTEILFGNEKKLFEFLAFLATSLLLYVRHSGRIIVGDSSCVGNSHSGCSRMSRCL